MCVHDPLHCIVPPYMLRALSQSDDRVVAAAAIEALAASAHLRAFREVTFPEVASAAKARRSSGQPDREVYDMKGRTQWYLPGTLVRSEGEGPTGDDAADEAYDYSGLVYDFYWAVLGRDSLDGRGMKLTSSVHVGHHFNNAFWNGSQMAYGDGDGVVFRRFTGALDVVAHELTHGVVANTSNLRYVDQSGALNEHFADVFGALVVQRHLGQSVNTADWTIGADVVVRKPYRRALRTFTAGRAYEDDPYLGTDPQPKHMDGLYTGDGDHGGVHINSGIPNHAFYLAAMALGGNAWETLGGVWYDGLRTLDPLATFDDAKRSTLTAAARDANTHAAVADAWAAVGL